MIELNLDLDTEKMFSLLTIELTLEADILRDMLDDYLGAIEVLHESNLLDDVIRSEEIPEIKSIIEQIDQGKKHAVINPITLRNVIGTHITEQYYAMMNIAIDRMVNKPDDDDF